MIGDEELILNAQRDGSKKRRSDKLNIYAKEYLYDDGLILIYKNKSKKHKTLIETLESKAFDQKLKGDG